MPPAAAAACRLLAPLHGASRVCSPLSSTARLRSLPPPTAPPSPAPPPRRRLYAFTDAAGKTKPGMVAVTDGSGGAVHLEVWEMPIENVGRFLVQVRCRALF